MRNVSLAQALDIAIQLFQAGNLDGAEKMCTRVLSAMPQSAEANHLRGVIADQMGDVPKAIQFLLVALKNDEANSEILFNLGVTFSKIDETAEAISYFQKAAALNPGSAEIFFQYANACFAVKDYLSAVPLYEKAIKIDPGKADYYGNLGATHINLGNDEDAKIPLDQAILHDPNHTNGHFYLGKIYHRRGDMDAAIKCHLQALKNAPEFVDALFDLANIYRKTGDLTEAANLYGKVLELRPDFMEAHSNFGVVLRNAGNPQAALKCFEKANEIDPNVAEVHTNMGAIYGDAGDLKKAKSCFERAFEIDPSLSSVLSNLIFIEDLDLQIDQAGQQSSRQNWDKLFIAPLADTIMPHDNDRTPDRKLRIGYVSGDFKNHSACHGFASLIFDHDRENFEVYCYDNNFNHDEMTVKLRLAADGWRSISGKPDKTVVEIIKHDQIDILVDLSGHSSGNRLPVFGYRPAPLQVNGIGHSPPGISTIDYRLTSEFSTPKAEEFLYPELPLYLNCPIGYKPPDPSPDVVPPPMLSNGYVTFGSFNRINKITQNVYPVWAEILHAVPGSKLLFKCKNMENEGLSEKIREIFNNLGISDDRLILLGQTGQYKHLEAINQVDICLDPFPHGGGITTLDCLWMGVPVLGQISDTKMSGRSNLVICGPLGMDEWATRSNETYVQAALDWAFKPAELAVLRNQMRVRFDKSYFNFAKDVETAYRAIWERWCKTEKPSPWDIKTVDS